MPNDRSKKAKKKGRPFRYSTFISTAIAQDGRPRAELARLIGVSVSSVYNWESGTSKPTDGNIVSMAKVLSFDPDELRALVPKQVKGTKVKAVKAIRKSARKPAKASSVSGVNVDAETLRLAELLAEARRQGFSVNIAVRKRLG